MEENNQQLEGNDQQLVEDSRDQYYEKKILILQKGLQHFEAQNSQRKQTIEQLEKTRDDLIANLDQLKKKINNQSNKYNILHRDYKLCENQLIEERNKYEQIQKSYNLKREQEHNELTEHFQQQMTKQKNSYDSMIQNNTRELNHWRHNFEQQIKQNIMMIDQLNKKDIQLKDLQNKNELLELQSQELKNKMDELLFQNENYQKSKDLLSNIKGTSVQTMDRLYLQQVNMELEFKNQLEQMQSSLTFERFKAAEQKSRYDFQVEQVKSKFMETISNIEQKVSTLQAQNIDLLKKREEDQMIISTIKNDQDIAVNIVKQACQNEIDIIKNKHRREIIKYKLIFWLKSTVFEKKIIEYREQQQNQPDIRGQFRFRTQQSSFYQKGEDILMMYFKAPVDQQSIVKDHFAADLIDQFQKDQKSLSQKYELKIASLDSQNNGLRTQVDKLKKQINQHQENEVSLKLAIEETEQQIERQKQGFEKELQETLKRKYKISLYKVRNKEIQNAQKEYESIMFCLKEDKNKLADTIDEMQNQIHQLQCIQNQLNHELTESKEEVNKALKYNEQNQPKIAEMQFKLESYKQSIRLLLTKIKQLKNQDYINHFEWQGVQKIEREIDQYYSHSVTRQKQYTRQQNSCRSKQSKSVQQTEVSNDNRYQFESPQPHVKSLIDKLKQQQYLDGDIIQEVKNLNNTLKEPEFIFNKRIFIPQKIMRSQNRVRGFKINLRNHTTNG